MRALSVRILLGNPDSPHVAERATNEGVGASLAAKIHNALVLYQPLRDLDGVEIRLHDTVLYNSIYRADDDVLVNTHTYGTPASHAPVLHLRHTTPGDLATTYLASFAQVWEGAPPGEPIREPSPPDIPRAQTTPSDDPCR